MTSPTDQLPHRYPFILVDRVLLREPGVRVVAEKLVSATEPYFSGHFPERPLVPGVLMLEMLAQAGGFLEAEPLGGQAIFLAGVQDARFRAPARPHGRSRRSTRGTCAPGGSKSRSRPPSRGSRASTARPPARAANSAPRSCW